MTPVLSSIIVLPSKDKFMPSISWMVLSCDVMHVIVAGLAAIASSEEVASTAPAAVNGSALSADRFQTVTEYPLCRSVLARALPMSPSPITEISVMVTLA